jgi:hypothetical protein
VAHAGERRGKRKEEGKEVGRAERGLDCLLLFLLLFFSFSIL